MKIGDFDINITTVRIGGGWQAEGILPDGKKVISGPKSSREDAEHDVEQQAKARLYPQRRYDVNRPFESINEDERYWRENGFLIQLEDGTYASKSGLIPVQSAENAYIFQSNLDALQYGRAAITGMKWKTVPAASALMPHQHRFESMNIDERQAKLGSGKRFAKLERKLSHQKGIRDPGAVAAAHGRETLGKKRFQKLAAAGRRRHSESVEQKYPELSPADEAVVMHQADQLLEAVALPDVHEIDPQTGSTVQRPECPNCGGLGEPFGESGRYSCPGCGTKFSADVSRYGAGGAYGMRPKAAFYPSDGGSAGGGGGITST